MPGAPPRATLLYDADCGFCTRAATIVASRLGRRSAIGLAPIRSVAGDALLGDLPEAVRDGSWHLVAADGRRWSAGAALGPLLRMIPALAWLAPLVEALPGPVDAGYRLVARHRGLLSRLLGGERCARPGG
jgi:predicted DCC family thiol-disulfide oxidoreductase YuxK